VKVQSLLTSDRSGVTGRIEAGKLKIILAQTVVFRLRDFVAIVLCIISACKWSNFRTSSRWVKAAWSLT
jgi:hypothetical protein